MKNYIRMSSSTVVFVTDATSVRMIKLAAIASTKVQLISATEMVVVLYTFSSETSCKFSVEVSEGDEITLVHLMSFLTLNFGKVGKSTHWCVKKIACL